MQTQKLVNYEFKSDPRQDETFALTTDGFTLAATITITSKPHPLGGAGQVHFLEKLAVVERFRNRGISRETVARALAQIGDGEVFVECEQPVHWRIFLDNGFRFAGCKKAHPVDVAILTYRRKKEDREERHASDDETTGHESCQKLIGSPA